MTDQAHERDEPADGAFYQYLRARLHRWDCPRPADLAAYFAGERAAEQATFEAHMASCPRCRSELALLASFLADEAEEAPVVAEDATELSATGPVPGVLTAVAAAALRGDESPPQKLSFEMEADTPPVELFLSIDQTNGDVLFLGQFTLTDYVEETLPDSVVELWQAGELVATTSVDELGAFTATLAEAAPVVLRITAVGGQRLVARVEP